MQSIEFHNRYRSYYSHAQTSTCLVYVLHQVCMATCAAVSSSSEATPRKRGGARSSVWNYFERDLSDSCKAVCQLWGEKYQHSNNTSNLAKVSNSSVPRLYWTCVSFLCKAHTIKAPQGVARMWTGAQTWSISKEERGGTKTDDAYCTERAHNCLTP